VAGVSGAEGQLARCLAGEHLIALGRPAELMYAYIVLSLLCGIRTEEARALRWAHVDPDGDPAAGAAARGHVAGVQLFWSEGQAASPRLSW
jgi:hypothetical protein